MTKVRIELWARTKRIWHFDTDLANVPFVIERLNEYIVWRLTHKNWVIYIVYPSKMNHPDFKEI